MSEQLKSEKKSAVFFCTLLMLLFSSCTNDIKNVASGKCVNQFTCDYKGRSRSFLLYLPETEKFEDTKLVVMLHGSGQSAQGFQQITEFEKDVLKHNYAVLYIDGEVIPHKKTVAAGWDNAYSSNGKKDLNFIVDLATYVQKIYGLNDSKFVVGFSNGGFMVHKLAIEKSDCFDGFISVAGMMPVDVWEHKNNKSVCFFQINGTKDDVVPMNLNGSASFNPNPAMEHVIEYYVSSSKIMGEAEKNQISNKIMLTKYGTTVWWLLIDDYHHGWPKNDSAKINVNELILEFLQKSG